MKWYQRSLDDGETWCGQEEKNAYVEYAYGRMVRYKGGGSHTTTVQNSYTPTPGEIQLAQASADYAKKVAPNAYYLNDLGRKLLENSLGAVQVDFNSLNQQGQSQIADATNGMRGLIGSNSAAAGTANSSLGNLSGQMGTLAKESAGRLGTLAGVYQGGTEAANKTLASLASGELPQKYQANMENSIRSALQNTMGKSLAHLGNRGVLNSSVTTGAMNDIQRNAADEVARQYQSNINQVAGLTQQQNTNTTALANNLGNLYNTQYQQLQNALGQQANLAQQQFANTQSSNAQNSALYGNLANLAGSRVALAAAAAAESRVPCVECVNGAQWRNNERSCWHCGQGGKHADLNTDAIGRRWLPRRAPWRRRWRCGTGARYGPFLFPAGHKDQNGGWLGKEH